MDSKQATSPSPPPRLVKFPRPKGYRFVRELGQGACGKTVLLLDEQIGEHYVCKKYQPYSEKFRQELFQGFVREVKLLHRLHHQNVVRVFNHYLYPELATGYILMEFIDGSEIDAFIASAPERLNDCFVQAVTGFSYLESCGVLHRDIRMQNLMVNKEGFLKIIDLGFGKKIDASADFRKSITLNWHCEPPAEFRTALYDFKTEIYFLGRLFQKLVSDNSVEDFKFSPLLSRMVAHRPEDRQPTFRSIETEIRSDRFSEIEFSSDDLSAYREFATAVFQFVASIERGAPYITDPEVVLTKLTDLYRRISMEEWIPDFSKVTNELIQGEYKIWTKRRRPIAVERLRQFVELLSKSSTERRRTILANLHAKLDAIDRYVAPPPGFDDDIPF